MTNNILHDHKAYLFLELAIFRFTLYISKLWLVESRKL